MSLWPDRWSEVVAIAVHARDHDDESAQTEVDALGHVDEAALVLEGGAAQGFFVRGWAALSRNWSALGTLTLWLRGECGSFVLSPVREPRPDVAAAHGRGVSQHAGFRALIPVEPLSDGDYRLVVQLQCEGRSALLETQTTLSVRDGAPHLRELEGQPLTHVVHVPKTGGTSFRAILEQTFGASLALQYDARLLINARTRCVQGHSYASNLLRDRPRTRLVMWFRDPVERVVSEYFHWRRNPATHPLDGQTLLQFARRREQLNLHRRCLDRLPLERIDCIGITEHFASSVALFARMFEVSSRALGAENVNPDKACSERYDLPAPLREQIALANRADLALYERATQRFFALCREHGVAVG